MAESLGSDLVNEFDLVSEELVELLEAGLPKGISHRDKGSPEGWDSKQLVAHMAELCEFWRHDLEEGLRRPRSAILGRSNHDDERTQRINALASLPTFDLIDRLTLEIGKTAGFLSSLTPADIEITVTHLTDGQITVGDMISSHLIAHLGEHLAQLRDLEQLPPSK